MHRPLPDFYSDLPKGRLRLSRLLWILAVLSSLAVVIAPAAVLLANTTVASRHSFIGTLRPLASPVAVTVPEGAFLKEILVERNEVVYAGQTVALLDAEVMTSQVAALDARLLHNDRLRACLLNHRSSEVDNDLSESLPAQQIQAVEDADRQCVEDADVTATMVLEFEKSRSLLKSDQKLLEGLIQSLLTSLDPQADAQSNDFRQVLSLQFARNRLFEREQMMVSEHERNMSEHRRDRRHRLATISRELQADQQMRQRLLALIDDPRLLSPDKGQVVRLRRLPLMSAALSDTEILEIRPSDSQGYLAEFFIPPTHLGYVKTGQDVEVQMLGLEDRITSLTGEIRHIQTQAPDNVKAIIELNAQSVAALDDPANGIALRGASTAAKILINYVENNSLERVNSEVIAALEHLGFVDLGHTIKAQGSALRLAIHSSETDVTYVAQDLD